MSNPDEFSDHKYFEADFTSYRTPVDMKECVGIFVREKPRRNEDGSKTCFIRFPAIIVTEWTANPMEFAKTLAEMLQENAYRFFESAGTPESETTKAADPAQIDLEDYLCGKP